MMIQFLLTEWVRHLEINGRVFPRLSESEFLFDPSFSDENKLFLRAKQLDQDGQLLHHLNQSLHRLQNIQTFITLISFVLGFMASYSLMQHSQQNFLFLLLTALGSHTLMLGIWLLAIVQRSTNPSTLLSDWLTRFASQAQPTLLPVLSRFTHTPFFFWRYSLFTHRLWLASLIGMMAAAFLLMLVRQYHFSWESTLLNTEQLQQVLHILAWLPEKLGFSIPNINTPQPQTWGHLFLGIIFCYGFIPRLLAWLVCHVQQHRHPLHLPIQDPYYQRILQTWRRRIIDQDDYQATPPSIPTPSRPAQTYWAVALDVLPTPNWFTHHSAHTWQNHGCLHTREELHQFCQQLQHRPTALLLAVRANHAPDRGQIRNIQLLAEHAAQLYIQLWLPENSHFSGSLQELIQQWQTTLTQHGYTWFAPHNPTSNGEKNEYSHF